MRIKSIALLALLALMLPLAAFAQSASSNHTPVGKWHTIDDKTGKVKSVVQIYEASDGSLQGKVVELLNSDHGPNALCVTCKGDRHNKPIVGMVIAWGLKKEGDSWEDGKILDPKSGKVYSAKMTPSADGQMLDVRGYMGFSLLGRTQTWKRVE